jgi:transposase
VKVAHPVMLRAIASAKKKNNKIDASKIADCLRCDFLQECHKASTEIRNRRRTLRYRNLLVRQTVQMKNRVSGLLMETGGSYNKQRLHKVGYFADLMKTNEEVDESIRPLLKLSREMICRSQKLDYVLVSSLERDPLLKERLRRLRTVPGVGPITALTWALEIGDVTRFTSIKQAISYCGLCGDERGSADKVMRMPISKQRNKHIQRVLIEAAKLGPRLCHELAEVRAKELEKGGPQSGPAGSCQEDGLLSARSGSQEARFRACREVQPNGSGLKTFPKKEKTKTSGFIDAQAARSRRSRLGEGTDSRGPLRIVSGLAENTNSIICEGS